MATRRFPYPAVCQNTFVACVANIKCHTELVRARHAGNTAVWYGDCWAQARLRALLAHAQVPAGQHGGVAAVDEADDAQLLLAQLLLRRRHVQLHARCQIRQQSRGRLMLAAHRRHVLSDRVSLLHSNSQTVLPRPACVITQKDTPCFV